MPEPSPPAAAAGSAPAEAAVRRRRSLSPIWIVPLVALLAAGWIAWRAVAERGAAVTITFETAEGLEPGKTRVRYKDIEVGTVEVIRLSEDLNQVIVTARMLATMTPYLTDHARFWIVRPRIGIGGVSGLGTLVSGAYIELDTYAGGQAQDSFTGVEEPPLIRSTAPGREFILRADTLGGVSRGAPLLHLGVQVGQVLGYELAKDRDGIVVHAFVEAPYDRLVKATSRFWNVSGVRLSSGDGFALTVPPLQALLVGGIAFDAGPDGTGEAAARDASFTLFASEDELRNTIGGPVETYRVFFNSSVRGLRPGAPVEFRGIRVGTVTDVRLYFDPDKAEFTIPVTLQIEPGRVSLRRQRREEDLQANVVMGTLVERGLRAQLATASLLTGDLYISLDFHDNIAPGRLAMDGDVAVIPAVRAELEQLTSSVTSVLERVGKLPLEQIAGELQTLLVAYRKLADGPDTTAALKSVQETMKNLQGLSRGLQRDLPATLSTLRGSAETATAALEQLRGTLESTEGLLGSNGQLRYPLVQAVNQLVAAARSIREFADYLDRHPDALIRGRPAQ